MKHLFLVRRTVLTLATLAIAVGLAVAARRLAPQFRNLAYLSGWFLFAVMLFLTAYNARKKLPFLPLGKSSTWLQLHAYVGWLSVAILFVHVGWRLPGGWFETALEILFFAVAASGVAGMVWSRFVPRRLTARGGEVLFERIPVIRRSLQDRAEDLALKSVAAARSSAIADFYIAHLADFFRGPANYWQHLGESRAPWNRIESKFDDLARFLDPEQRKVLAQVSDLARQKDGLDYQHALQSSLKLWLFVHVPLTYGLLVFTALHVVLVYGFSIGAGFRP
ncbi:MAG: hypothetical protein DVB31_16880 [Verrucomicrobia bacterium]|nr:MAG: hypothetical protein DVB31_16880 [Verrucomicrobiota bacterium]